MPEKTARSTPRPPFELPRGSLSAVLREGRESANIHISSGAIWGIPVEKASPLRRMPNDPSSNPIVRHTCRDDGCSSSGAAFATIWSRSRRCSLVDLWSASCPPDKAFSGFSDDIVIIVGSALVVSAAVARSGVIEVALIPGVARRAHVPAQVVVLVTVVTVLSAFVKNIGALAMMIPSRSRWPADRTLPSRLPDADGFRLAARRPDDPGRHLAQHHRRRGARRIDRRRPSACSTSRRSASARGRRVSSSWRSAIASCRGIARGAATIDEALDIKDYVTEARVAPGSRDGRQPRSRNCSGIADGGVTVTGLISAREPHRTRRCRTCSLGEDDLLLLRGRAGRPGARSLARRA